MNTESQILNVPIEDIIPNRFQPRIAFDETALKELSSSIKEHGIIQPLVLRRLGDKFEIIAGERRYKAAKMAGLSSVPAIISKIDDKKSAEVAIVENIQRRDLSSIEEAKSYKQLLDKGYLTQEELAKKMGLSQSAISNKLRLLSLSEEVQEALIEGKISERHARSLLQLNTEELQNEWLEKIIKERLTVRELDKMLKDKPELTNKLKENENTSNNETRKQIDISELINNFIPPKIKEVPNKFFNELEKESTNMNILEENDKKEEVVDFLDFEIPPIKVEPNEPKISKDMSLANGLIDKVTNELKQSNYTVKLEKNETTNEVKYIISIEK